MVSFSWMVFTKPVQTGNGGKNHHFQPLKNGGCFGYQVHVQKEMENDGREMKVWDE